MKILYKKILTHARGNVFSDSMENEQTWRDWAIRLAHELSERNGMTYHAITDALLEKFATFAKENP